jgi:tetratricopeptide (TPR) repeat protein
MYDDRPDDPIPPLDRPGVSPVWRLVAILGGLFVALLLSMVIVMFMVLAQQTRQNVNNAWAANAAMPPVAAVADAAEDPIDPVNPAYPLKQNLRPAGTFPLPGDPELPPENPAPALRKEFRGLGGEPAWISNDSDLPDRVLVSPSGDHMAFAVGDVLMAGPVGAPEIIDPNAAGAFQAGMGPGMRGIAPARWGAAQPPRSSNNGLRAVVCGWSENTIVWVGGGGRPREYNVPRVVATSHEPRGAEAALLLPGERLLAVTRRQSVKVDGAPAHDLCSVSILPPPGADRVPQILIADDLARWDSPALSPDGKRLAIVSDSGEKSGRRRVFLFALEGKQRKAEPVSPSADRIEGVCWTPDGKALVYARSQSSVPADHALGSPKDACDLFLLDLEARKETRLSRGGGFTSPSVTTDGKLFVLTTVQPAGAAPTVQLLQMTLKAAQEWAAGQENRERDRAKQWKELANLVLKQAGVSAERDHGDTLVPGSQKKIADAFARIYTEKFNADPPKTADGLDGQRREVAGLDLTPEEQARFTLLLGAVEGEYLRDLQKGSDWHSTKELGGAGGPVSVENSFGYAFNPFRSLRSPEKADKDESPQSLAEVLFRAEGRPIVLSNDAVSAKAALDNLVDPERAHASALLAQDKADEADWVLLRMAERHAANQYLTVEVGTLLHRRGRTKALARLVDPLLKQLDNGGLELARDPRLYNLLGVALLEDNANKAIIAFQDALRCDLNYGPVYLNLAQAYQKASRTNDARQCLRRYLKLFPEGEWADDARRRLAVAGDE